MSEVQRAEVLAALDVPWGDSIFYCLQHFCEEVGGYPVPEGLYEEVERAVVDALMPFAKRKLKEA